MRFYIKLLLTIILIVLPIFMSTLSAQAPPPPPPPQEIPIDGGLGALLLAGLGYGAKKIRENKKENA